MEDKKESSLSKLRIPIILFVVFWMIAILFWQLKGKVFYLFNFGYIGTAIAIGAGAYELLPRKKKPGGRRFAQFIVGIYMLGFLGLIKYENMQVEGFFFYLLGGFLLGLSFTILLQRSFSQSFLEGVGAAGPAGQPWFWITFPIKETNQGGFLPDGKNCGTFILDSVFLWSLFYGSITVTGPNTQVKRNWCGS